MLFDALTLGLGYNAALVSVGAALLGLSAGVTGAFLFLRKRALVSDAISHATLPGLALAFMIMVSFGGDGRSLAGLMLGAAASAAVGLLAVQWLAAQPRLSEDTAIGAVLSVFFGAGVVLLTIVQMMSSGQQAGLEGFLLGATAGMLFSDAVLIALSGAVVIALALAFRRPMMLAAFDPDYADSAGVNLRRTDLITMALAMAVTVIGLKVVGLILIVALLIIPPVAARFWSDRSDVMVWVAGVMGAVASYVGAAISATAPDLPTGPVIVLTAFAVFALSMLFAPARGLIAGAWRYRKFQHGIHRRQGLLSLALRQPIYEPRTLRLLTREGLARADGVPTETGRAEASRTLRDEHRWDIARKTPSYELAAARYDGLTRLEDVLTADQIAEIDARIAPPTGVG